MALTPRSILISLVLWSHVICCVSGQSETKFVCNGFRGAELDLDGVSKVLPNGLLQLTNTSLQQMGHAFYRNQIDFGSGRSLSFSTSFVFAMVPRPQNPGGHGIAFVISPTRDFSQAVPTQYLGLFNISNNGLPSNRVLAIEFDTVLSAEFQDEDANHVGIDVNSMISLESAPASYFSNKEMKNNSLKLLSGDPLQAWIVYDGSEMLLNITIAPVETQRPNQPLLSRFINLSEIFLESMYVGFSAATGSLASDQYVLGWSFSNSVKVQNLDILSLPPLPPRKGTSNKPSLWLIILLVLSAIVLMAIFGGICFYRGKKYRELREVWEKEYGPHRFSYKTLYKATRGFHKDLFLGEGGSGEVYRGIIPESNKQIAVKRVFHAGEQGMKQFVAEIVSMGQLKHRNLVPLLGYCRRKGELLLVSEYMSNGSLDQYLFSTTKPVLSWSQRLKILRGIASALAYLHEGGEQVVCHRDIKASNVMLDDEMNGRLGDFGMARVHRHGNDPQATIPVGTIGYMAPELTTCGTSTKTDVFAFGAFALEVACGRRPVVYDAPAEKKQLVKWVLECWRKGRLREAQDTRLKGHSVAMEEFEMVLKLGLICSNFFPEARPNMSQVAQYLNRDVELPETPPHTPGIGMSTAMNNWPEIVLSPPSLSVPSSSSSGNNSMFITHTIFHGGR